MNFETLIPSASWLALNQSNDNSQTFETPACESLDSGNLIL